MKLHDVYTRYKEPALISLACGTVALTAACGSSSGSAESGHTALSTSSVSAPVAVTSGEGACNPDATKVGDMVDPSTSTPVFVLAGIAELSDGTYVGRPPLVEENGKWDVASLRHVAGKTALLLVDLTSLSKVNVFAQGVVDASKDGCLTSPGTVRPTLQGQAVTTTGTVLFDGQTYASFNNGSPTAFSAAQAYEDGAIDVPMTQLLPGFEELQNVG